MTSGRWLLALAAFLVISVMMGKVITTVCSFAFLAVGIGLFAMETSLGTLTYGATSTCLLPLGQDSPMVSPEFASTVGVSDPNRALLMSLGGGLPMPATPVGQSKGRFQSMSAVSLRQLKQFRAPGSM